jgi:hypothetical protein
MQFYDKCRTEFNNLVFGKSYLAVPSTSGVDNEPYSVDKPVLTALDSTDLETLRNNSQL